MADDFDKALAARPTDPKEQAAARARYRCRLAADANIGEFAVRVGILIENVFLNGKSGLAWPSLDTLANGVGCKRRAVIRAVRQLSDAGHILVRSGGGSESNRYTLPWLQLLSDDGVTVFNHAVSDGAPVHDETPVSDKTRGWCLTGHGGGVARDTGVVSDGTPEPLDKNLSIEPSEITCTEGDSVSEAVDLYNALADKVGLARCMKITKQRRSSIRARLKDAGGLEGWRAALERVEASSYLRGGGDRGWRTDIDHLSSERGFTKIMEGGFDDRPAHAGGDPMSVAGSFLARKGDRLAAVDEVFAHIKQSRGE